MRAVLQRAAGAFVTADGEIIGEIGKGLLILLGVAGGDTEEEARLLAHKAAGLRIFEDSTGKMNESVLDAGGEALVVSNFTLYGDSRRGKRPDFTHAAPFEKANTLYGLFIRALKDEGVSRVETGRFGADMKIRLLADGPVTILLDTEELR